MYIYAANNKENNVWYVDLHLLYTCTPTKDRVTCQGI